MTIHLNGTSQFILNVMPYVIGAMGIYKLRHHLLDIALTWYERRQTRKRIRGD